MTSATVIQRPSLRACARDGDAVAVDAEDVICRNVPDGSPRRKQKGTGYEPRPPSCRLSNHIVILNLFQHDEKGRHRPLSMVP
jgi:hypothetical protein